MKECDKCTHNININSEIYQFLESGEKYGRGDYYLCQECINRIEENRTVSEFYDACDKDD